MRNNQELKRYDLNSVRFLYTGAAPLGPELSEELSTLFPGWKIRQGYGKNFQQGKQGGPGTDEVSLLGLTESCGNVTHTIPQDVWNGSSGSLLPSYEAKLVSPNGSEITGYDQAGELLIKSPSICMGYYRNEAATKELFSGGWMRTGDQALVRVSPAGYEHFFIVERIKELIKVKARNRNRLSFRERLLMFNITTGLPGCPCRTRSSPSGASSCCRRCCDWDS